MTKTGCSTNPTAFKETNEKEKLKVIPIQLFHKSKKLLNTIDAFTIANNVSTTDLSYKIKINWHLFKKYPVRV